MDEALSDSAIVSRTAGARGGRESGGRMQLAATRRPEERAVRTRGSRPEGTILSES
jgi:hypothetical protein